MFLLDKNQSARDVSNKQMSLKKPNTTVVWNCMEHVGNGQDNRKVKKNRQGDP